MYVQVHNLSGPVAVTDASGEPAHPGDLLMVEICNLGPLPGDEWGFTGTFDRENGGMVLEAFLMKSPSNTFHSHCLCYSLWEGRNR